MQNEQFTDSNPFSFHIGLKKVNNPLLVLNDFFSDDWLPGHLERLKKWRYYVLAGDYYKDAKGSPSGLLYFHELNICLIEAMHIYKGKCIAGDVLATKGQLEEEQKNWRDFPVLLNETELMNPLRVIEDFFRDYDRHQYCAIIYEWLEYGLSSCPAAEFIETGSFIRVYENLQKLYCAAWLIFQRTTEKPRLKAQTLPDLAEVPFNISAVDTASLYRLNYILTSDIKQQLPKLVAIIGKKVDSVQGIMFLGANNAGTLFLLVFTADEEQRQAQGLGSTIEESCREIARVVALVHHASSFQNGLANDSPFFNRALHCPVIYLSGSLVLPDRKPIGCSPAGLSGMDLWDRWYNQGKDFLSGAEYYLKIEAYGTALFSLQQCVECLLIAVIRSVLGYRVNNHNLSKLLIITQMFTNDLSAVFNLEDDEGARLFDLLKHAYVNVRYKDTFTPETKSLKTLYQVTKHFVSIVDLVHQKHLLTSSI